MGVYDLVVMEKIIGVVGRCVLVLDFSLSFYLLTGSHRPLNGISGGTNLQVLLV